MAVRTWIGKANSFWDISSNWSNNQPPILGDDVVISTPEVNITTTYRSGNISLNSLLSDEAFILYGGILTFNTFDVNNTFTISDGTLTLNGTTGSDIDNFTQTNGILTGPGNVIINSSFNWAGGTESGAGKTSVKGTLNIGDGGGKFLNARTLETRGNTIWKTTSSYLSSNTIYASNGAIWNNASTGNFDWQSDGTIFNNGAAASSFNNAGTLIKSVGTSTGSSTIPLLSLSEK